MNDAAYDASKTSPPASRSARMAKSNFGALLCRSRASVHPGDGTSRQKEAWLWQDGAIRGNPTSTRPTGPESPRSNDLRLGMDQSSLSSLPLWAIFNTWYQV